MLLEPYIKSKVSAVLDTTYRKPLQSFGYVTKRKTYIVFPAINIANTWRGASEIVAKLNFSLGYKQSILSSFSTPPPNTNYCACISWKPTSNTIVRHKLWKNLGEILYVDDYSGQTTNKDFSIEIWNTPAANLTSDSFRIATSQLIVPTDFCDESDIEITQGLRNCTDLIFDLSLYEPVEGDYYITVSDCGETDLIKPPKLISDFVTIQSTDGTWHNFSFKTIAGNIYEYTDQTNAAPNLTPFIPMIYGVNVYSFALKAFNDPVFGLTHYPYLTGPVGNVLDYGTAYGKVVLKSDDLSQHVFRLIANASGELLTFIDQNIYVP